jgi:hypothetical protein
VSQRRFVYDTLDALLDALSANGVRAVGVRAVDEVRPAPTPSGEGIVVGPQRWVDVTGYRDGVVYALRIVDAAPGPVEAALRARGFKVRTGSDNLM